MQPHPPCTINYFCIGAVLLFAGSILLVTLGFTVVLPQQKTRRWPQVKCTVRSSVLHRNLCSCDKQFTRKGVECFGKFPCLEIFVTYQRIYKANDSTDDVTVSVPANSLPIVFNTSLNVSCHLHDNSTLPDLKLGETNTTTGDRTAGTTLHTVNGHTISSSSSQTDGVTSGVRSVTSSGMSISQSPPTTKTPVEAVRDNLPDTAGVLFKSWSDAFYNQCAIFECGEEEWTMRENLEFRLKWGTPGQSYPCYYDPQRPDVVIVERTGWGESLHAVLWPALSLLVGATLWLCLCCGCCKLKEEIEDEETYYTVH